MGLDAANIVWVCVVCGVGRFYVGARVGVWVGGGRSVRYDIKVPPYPQNYGMSVS